MAPLQAKPTRNDHPSLLCLVKSYAIRGEGTSAPFFTRCPTFFKSADPKLFFTPKVPLFFGCIYSGCELHEPILCRHKWKPEAADLLMCIQ